MSWSTNTYWLNEYLSSWYRYKGADRGKDARGTPLLLEPQTLTDTRIHLNCLQCSPTMEFPVVSLLLAILLSGHGLRKKSLSPSGAYTAFIVGFFTMAGGSRVFGVSLIGFYLVGSRATKCKHIL